MYCELFLEFLCNFYSIKFKFFWNFFEFISTPSIQNLFSNSKVISQHGWPNLKIFLQFIETVSRIFIKFLKTILQNFSEFSHYHFSKIFFVKIIWNGWPLTRPIIWNVLLGNFLGPPCCLSVCSKSVFKIKIENFSKSRD